MKCASFVACVTAGSLRFIVGISLLALASTGFAQSGPDFIVDCTGTMAPAPNIFPNIKSFLQKVGPEDFTVAVNGTCVENVTISNGDNFHLTGVGLVPPGIRGKVSIVDSPDRVYLSGLNITNVNGDGIYVSNSNVVLQSCNVSGNAGNGVSMDNSSHVTVDASGTYDDNEGYAGAFNVSNHSFLKFVPWAGVVEIRGNTQSGIWASQADIWSLGNVVISGTVNGPGIVLLGGARAQLGNSLGSPNIIEKNPNGGISLRENSEVSLWLCCSNTPNLIRNNGKFGIASGFHSQVTLDGAQVTDNDGPGVDVYSGSQLDFFPGSQNLIANNGTPSNPNPGLRVDGNSEAWLRGGDVANNSGPGIEVRLNSSIDFSGVNFGTTTGGGNVINANGITCDSTSIAVGDLRTVGCSWLGAPINRP